MKAFVCVLSVAVTVGAVLAHAEPLDKCRLQPEPRGLESIKDMDYLFTEDKLFVAKVASALKIQFKRSNELAHLDLPVRAIHTDPEAYNVFPFQTDCAEMRVIVDDEGRNSTVPRINVQYQFVKDNKTVKGACNVLKTGMEWPPGTHYACPRPLTYPCKAENPSVDYRVELLLQAFEFEVFEKPQTKIGFTTRQVLC